MVVFKVYSSINNMDIVIIVASEFFCKTVTVSLNLHIPDVAGVS